MTIFEIIFFVVCIAPLIIFGIATTRLLLKDIKKDKYEYPKLKNFSDYDTTRN